MNEHDKRQLMELSKEQLIDKIEKEQLRYREIFYCESCKRSTSLGKISSVLNEHGNEFERTMVEMFVKLMEEYKKDVDSAYEQGNRYS